jgi:ankyrin repeat protein
MERNVHRALVGAVALLLTLSACVSEPGDGGVLETSATTVQYESLIDAVNAADVASVRTLLEAGADPDEDPGNGFLPLHVAALRGDATMVEALLAGGADPNARAEDGQVAIIKAAILGRGDVITALIAGGANVNAVHGTDDRTALHEAAANDNADAIKALVAGGADIDLPSTRPGYYLTALMLASKDDRRHALRALLELGADGSDLDAQGSTAWDWAYARGHSDSMAILEEFGYTE